MDDELLISLVEANEELYDKGNTYYKFHGRKKSIWEQIGKELHTSGELCRRRWIALRDRFGREVRKSAAPSGSGAEYYRPWYLLESMQFLKPHVIPRPIRCSQNVCPEMALRSPHVAVSVPSPSPPIHVPWPSPSPSVTISLDSSSPEIMVSIPSISPPEFISVDSPSPTSSSPPPPSPAPSQPQRSSGKKRGRSTDVVEKSMLEAIELFKKKCVEKENECGNPTVNSFGKMIVGMISKMSEAKQTRTMQRMMEVIFEAQQEPERIYMDTYVT